MPLTKSFAVDAQVIGRVEQWEKKELLLNIGIVELIF